MAATSTRPNKNFADEMTQFNRSWIVGTPEYYHRLSFPGNIPSCNTEECINNQEKMYKSRYWLCDICGDQVPDSRDYNVHAPSQNIMPKDKRKKQSIYAFVAILKNKPLE